MNIINKITDKFREKGFISTGVFWMTSGQHDFTWKKAQALNYYRRSLYVNRAISKRAEKMGQIEFVLFRGEKPIENEWTKLLAKPNHYMTGDQFWATVQKHLDIAGAAYLLKDEGEFSKRVKSLTPLDVDKTETVLTIDKQDIAGFRTIKGKDTITYTPEQVIYIHRPHPENPLLPESLIASAVRAIETEIQISEYHANVIKNGGKIESIFKVKSGAKTREQLEEIERQYTEKYATARNAGRPLFLSGDMEREEVGLKPAELSYLETKTASLNDICIATGVPKVLLGVGSGETYANADAEMRTFYSDTIKPAMELLVDVLNLQLIPNEFTLDFIDPTPQDTEKGLAVLKTASDIHALTINEKREALSALGLDLEERKDADALYMPFNLAEVGREKTTETKTKSYHPLKSYENRRRHEKAMQERLDAEEDRFKRELDSYLRGQEQRVLESLTKSKAIDDLDINLEIKIGRERLLPMLKDIFISTGQAVAADYATGVSFSLTPAIMESLTKRTDIFLKQINETTFDRLKGEFQDSIAAGEPRAKLVGRIKDTYAEIDKGRAKTIARTEVHNAMQNANFEAQKQAGMEIKIWVCSFQDSRDAHMEADGQERKLNEPFIVGGEEMMFPGDGSAENSINCACTI